MQIADRGRQLIEIVFAEVELGQGLQFANRIRKLYKPVFTDQ